MNVKQTPIPTLVRVKPGALDRIGIYARRNDFGRVVLLYSQDLKGHLLERAEAALKSEGIEIAQSLPIGTASFEKASELFQKLTPHVKAVIGLGGGKALDVAKYIAFLAGLPYLAIPTSLSNDGICSPQSSLTFANRRRSLVSAMPFGVVLDTEVCLHAPEILWLSGVGDVVAKFTAVTDWKLAFHAKGEAVDDFAALLSEASVGQFISRPERDLEGMRLLGTTLILNGIAMSICGSSRPASGSEHLISHALDSMSARPRLHGLQVGVATYLISILQGAHTEEIADLFDKTGFWKAIAADPFSMKEWVEAIKIAPSIKPSFYTILSSSEILTQAEEILRTDKLLKSCFID